ncbi:MAG: acyltransferase family protein, partial [Leptospira sp.]|nr:acyltransferase family protein [Leptospira sp.]
MSRKEIGSEKSGYYNSGIMANGVRLGYLDNLRSFALLLGILFHVSIVYSEEIKYAIQNNERSYILSYFCYFIHGFRMPLFFMIAGFFSALVFERKGGFEFIKARFARVVLPMLFGLIFLSPIQYYLVQKIKKPELEVIKFVLDFFSVEKFEHSHIWFLVNLSVYSFLFYLLPKSIFKKIPGTQGKNNFSFLIFFFIISLILLSIFHYFYPKGESFLGVSKLTFVYQLLFFFLGICSYYKNLIFEKTPSK